jgi:hypothetical protein
MIGQVSKNTFLYTSVFNSFFEIRSHHQSKFTLSKTLIVWFLWIKCYPIRLDCVATISAGIIRSLIGRIDRKNGSCWTIETFEGRQIRSELWRIQTTLTTTLEAFRLLKNQLKIWFWNTFYLFIGTNQVQYR